MKLGIPYVESEWPHGLMCTRCPHVFREGESFTTFLHGLANDTPITDVVCLFCATSREPAP